MRTLEHPNIARFHEVRNNAIYTDRNGNNHECLAIVMEYIEGGELYEYVARCGKFSPRIARTYFKMLLDALSYMHSRGITHRDIKPENILLDRNFNLKVTDFGFSTYLSRGELHTRLGTEAYMAPEIRERRYDGKDVDLFAAGIILFILYTGGPPFEKSIQNLDPYYRIFCRNNSQFWEAHSRRRPAGFFTPEFKELINRMLKPEPEDRYTMGQVRNHDWTTGECATLEEIAQ